MSRSHTNVTLSSRYNHTDRLYDDIEKLKWEKEQLEKKVNWLFDELSNIPEAVKEWGYVDIKLPDGTTIKLIDANTVKTEAK